MKRSKQCVNSLLHFCRSQIPPVFQLKLQATGSTQSWNSRRNHSKCLPCLYLHIHFAIKTVDNGSSRMLLPFPFVPVFQDNKIGRGVTLLTSAHHGETSDSNVILHFRIRIQNSIDFIPDSLCTFQAGCRRKLNNSNKITIIFIRNKCRRPTHKEYYGNHCQNSKRYKRDKRTLKQPFHRTIVDSLCLIIRFIKSFVYKEVRRFALFEE